MPERDGVLICWIIAATLWDVLVFGFTGWVVFWRGHSWAWFFPAYFLSLQGTLFKVLRKRYGIAEE